jgi:hypothetical protein
MNILYFKYANLKSNKLVLSIWKWIITKYTTYVSLYLFWSSYLLCIKSNFNLFSKAKPFPMLYRARDIFQHTPCSTTQVVREKIKSISHFFQFLSVHVHSTNVFIYGFKLRNIRLSNNKILSFVKWKFFFSCRYPVFKYVFRPTKIAYAKQLLR